MGWLIREKYVGEKIDLSNYIRNKCEGDSIECVGVSVVSNVGYAAIRYRKTDEVFAVIFMIRNTRTEIGYKDMTESMGPYHYDCPPKILNMLSETTHETSLAWRTKCWERSRDNKRYKKISNGTEIKLLEPVYFGHNSEYGPYPKFKCLNRSKSHYEAFNGHEYRTKVRLRKGTVMDAGFEILI